MPAIDHQPGIRGAEKLERRGDVGNVAPWNEFERDGNAVFARAGTQVAEAANHCRPPDSGIGEIAADADHIRADRPRGCQTRGEIVPRRLAGEKPVGEELDAAKREAVLVECGAYRVVVEPLRPLFAIVTKMHPGTVIAGISACREPIGKGMTGGTVAAGHQAAYRIGRAHELP